MFFFWWRAGSEKLLDVMEVTVRWQQSDSWQKRREKRVWHQQRDWQKMKLGSSHRGSVCLQSSDETWQFFLSFRRPSSQLSSISLVTAAGYHLHSEKNIYIYYSVSDWGINLRCGMKWPHQIDLSWSRFCTSLFEYTKEVISTLTRTFYSPFTGLER